METRLCYRTPLFDEVRRFYEHTLGWGVYKEWEHSETDKGVVYFAGTVLLEILQSEIETKFDDGFYLYQEVPDIGAVHAHLQKSGENPSDIQSHDWGHDSFIIKDPAGFCLKFFQQTV